MKIYIAAPYPLRHKAVVLMQELEDRGHEVTSRWLKAPDELSDAFARENLADVDACDVLLAYNPPEFENSGTGGRHIEFGYMLYRCMNIGWRPGRAKQQIVLLGNRSNIFHHLDFVRVIQSLEEL